MSISQSALRAAAISMGLLATASCSEEAINDPTVQSVYDQITSSANPAAAAGHFFITKDKSGKETGVIYVTNVNSSSTNGKGNVCLDYNIWNGHNEKKNHGVEAEQYCRPAEVTFKPIADAPKP